jgi:hypothetical protein
LSNFNLIANSEHSVFQPLPYLFISTETKEKEEIAKESYLINYTVLSIAYLWSIRRPINSNCLPSLGAQTQSVSKDKATEEDEADFSHLLSRQWIPQRSLFSRPMRSQRVKEDRALLLPS